MPLTRANLSRNLALRFPVSFYALDDFSPIHIHETNYRASGIDCQRSSDINLYNNSDMEKTFGERVREARKSLKLTQKQLAKKSGLSQTTISDIERGRNAASKEILQLAQALHQSAEYLQFGTIGAIPAPITSVNDDEKELLALWEQLLPGQRAIILSDIRKEVDHNAALLALLQARTGTVMKERTVIVSDRRKSMQPFENTERREKDG
jgi:transcriptional regulator with XRE-family HTH domain